MTNCEQRSSGVDVGEAAGEPGRDRARTGPGAISRGGVSPAGQQLTLQLGGLGRQVPVARFDADEVTKVGETACRTRRRVRPERGPEALVGR